MHYNSLQEMQESPDINTSRMEYGGNVNEYDNRSHVSSFKSYQTYIQNPHNSKRPKPQNKQVRGVNLHNKLSSLQNKPISYMPMEEMHYISVKHQQYMR